MSVRSGRIYADHAATTVVREEVARRMLDVMAESGANPSSLHAEGRRARAVLDDARERVAAVLGVRSHEIVFTGGGSESDALAIRGAAMGAAPAKVAGRGVVFTAATEHHAVLHAIHALEADGFEPRTIAHEASGVLEPQQFAEALDAAAGRGVLASIMLANNETGVVQPVAELASIARERGVLFHCDAVQAPGRVPIRAGELGVDLLALSGHKFYGPKGVGALYVRDGVAVAAQVHGGGQEAGRRAGTENVAGIAGFALALELAEAERPREAPRLSGLRDLFESELLRLVPDARFTTSGTARLPHLTSFAVPGVEADVMLARLDLDGAAVSSGSACAAGAIEPSHVLAALALPAWAVRSTIRVSFGRSNDEQEVRRLAGMVANIAASREAALLSGHRPERF